MNDNMPYIVVALATTSICLVGLLAIAYVKASTTPVFYKTIAECEAELPRSQTCEMVAVVKRGDE